MGRNSNDRSQTACLARAIAAELRRVHPVGTQKAVARDLGCGLKLAESILSGHLSAPTIAKIIGAYGPGWVAERVLEAAGLTLENYIRAQAEEAQAAAHQHQKKAEELAQLEAQLRASRRPQSESYLGDCS